MHARLPDGQLSLAQLIRLSKAICEQTDRKVVRGAILEWQSRPLRIAGAAAVSHFWFPQECLPPLTPAAGQAATRHTDEPADANSDGGMLTTPISHVETSEVLLLREASPAGSSR